MSKNRASRSNYFIQAGLQIRFTFILILIVVLVAMITFVNLYVIGDYVVSNSETIVDLRDMQSFVSTVFSVVGFRILLVGIVCFMIISIIGIFFSHRFAGPSYKLEKCLKEMSQGDLTFDIKLRNGDALHNVADSINFLVTRFRDIIFKSREVIVDLKEASHKLDDNSETKKIILDKIFELEDLLAGFQVTKEEVSQENNQDPK